MSTQVILPHSTEQKLTAVDTDGDVHAALKKCIEENQSYVFRPGLLANISAQNEISLGPPIALPQNLRFFPVITPDGRYTRVPFPRQIPSMPTVLTNFFDKAETILNVKEQYNLELPGCGETLLHGVGVVLAGFEVWKSWSEQKTLTSKNSSKADETFLDSVCHCGSRLISLIGDLPWLKNLKPGVDLAAAVIDGAGKIFIVPAKTHHSLAI